MEPSHICRACSCHHHAHHHHHLILIPRNHQLIRCPFHSRHLHHHRRHHHHHHQHQIYHFNCPSHVSASFAPSLPQNSKPISDTPLKNDFNAESEAIVFRNGPDKEIMQLEQQYQGLEVAEDDDEEPIFVLTDEWREFFAKSEAKRKLEKKQAKKKK